MPFGFPGENWKRLAGPNTVLTGTLPAPTQTIPVGPFGGYSAVRLQFSSIDLSAAARYPIVRPNGVATAASYIWTALLGGAITFPATFANIFPGEGLWAGPILATDFFVGYMEIEAPLQFGNACHFKSTGWRMNAASVFQEGFNLAGWCCAFADISTSGDLSDAVLLQTQLSSFELRCGGGAGNINNANYSVWVRP